jgi:hypothetical protein
MTLQKSALYQLQQAALRKEELRLKLESDNKKRAMEVLNRMFASLPSTVTSSSSIKEDYE